MLGQEVGSQQGQGLQDAGAGAEARPKRSVLGMGAAQTREANQLELERLEKVGSGEQREAPGRAGQGADPLSGEPSGCWVLYS